MAKDYVRKSGKSTSVRTSTPQMKRAREDQVKNYAGGFVFKVSDMDYVRRFLILGTDSPTYYASSKKLTKDAAKHVEKMLKSPKAVDVINEAVDVSVNGRAAKNDPAIFVLALAANSTKPEVRKYALSKLSDVCRIFTHLATFLTFYQNLRTESGWGRGIRSAVSRWYNERKASGVAYQMCKYPSRRVEGETPWTHRDVLRKAHVIPVSDDHNTAFRYAVKGSEGFDGSFDSLIDTDLVYIYAHEAVKSAKSAAEVIKFIDGFNVTWESVPTELRNNKTVWDALVQKMPMTATIRNLGKMTNVGTLKDLSKNARLVADRLTDEAELKKARVHPVSLLGAMRTYGKGTGVKGSLTWSPVSVIKDALEEAFYKSFNYVEPTGKNYLIGVDVSGSMSWGNVAGMDCLTPAEGAAAMAMTIARTEKNYKIMGFADTFRDLGITAKDSLDDALRKTSRMNFGSTDCSLPMTYASKHNLDVDVFIVITDNETWAGRNVQPFQALKQYRAKHGCNAKLIVIGMTGTPFTIADPSDPGMLDIVGFDTNAPTIISQFVNGQL